MNALNRLELLRGAGPRVSPVSEPEELIAEAVTKWRTIKQSELTTWRLRSYDISEMEADQVRTILKSSGLDRDNYLVRVIWPFDCVAADVEARDAVQYYDDLWYPSRDDVLVFDETQSLFVELNHEEILTVGWRSESRPQG